MPGIDEPGPPPEVPEEYAAVYRDAYQRALDEAAGSGGDASEDLIPFAPAPPRPAPARFAPLLFGGVVVLVVAVVLGVGMLLGPDEPTAPEEPVGVASEPAPTPTLTPTPPPTPTTAPEPSQTPARTVWDGEVGPVVISEAAAACTSPPSVDAAGARVEYQAGNAVDGDPTTAWRCDGEAIGETVRLVLPAGTPVAEVGLIPGYAKTDPASGADRFTENNRITRVRWTFEDGTEVVQELDPTDRTVQRLRVPRTESGTIVLEVLAVERGTRNRTAISEIEVALAR